MHQHIETHRLAQRATLPHSHDVSLLDLREGGRPVCGKVLVSFLEPLVLGDPVQVVPADDEGAGHLGGEHDALEDSPTDRDGAGEWALLVHVGTGLCLLWGLEA